MAALLRPCSPALALALCGGVPLYSADVFQINLVDGTTILYWTSWPQDLQFGGQTYKSTSPFVKRSKWSVVKTMQVATMDLTISTGNAAFNGGAQLKTQIHNGLLDGAFVLLTRVFMLTPEDTTALGGIDLFGGDVGAIDLGGLTTVVKVKAKINRLDMQTPRNFFKVGCLHGFCDVGCTLSRGSFTTSDVVGVSPTNFFVPWTSAPATPAKYVGGTIAFTSGANSGSRRNIVSADASGATVVYPLNFLPAPGDAFTRFEGCNKIFDDGVNVQDCTGRSNTQHYRGFEFTPPPLSAY
jgi:hypothetical protein